MPGSLNRSLPKPRLHLSDRIKRNPHIGGEKRKAAPFGCQTVGTYTKLLAKKKREKKKEGKVVALLNHIYINDMNDRLKGKIINLSFQLFFYCPTISFGSAESGAIKHAAGRGGCC